MTTGDDILDTAGPKAAPAAGRPRLAACLLGVRTVSLSELPTVLVQTALALVGPGQAVARISLPDGRTVQAIAILEGMGCPPTALDTLPEALATADAAPPDGDGIGTRYRIDAEAVAAELVLDRGADADDAALTALVAAAADRAAHLIDRERLQLRQEAGQRLRGLLAGYRLDLPFADQVSSRIDLLKSLVGADGCLFRADGRWRGLRRSGLSPREAMVLGDAVERAMADRGVWRTDCLAADCGAGLPDSLAGILAIRMDGAPRDLLVFTRRADRTLPVRKPKVSQARSDRADRGGGRGVAEILQPLIARPDASVHPARPWSDIDLETAEELRLLLQDAIFRIAERFRSIEAELEARTSELSRSEAETELARGRDVLTGLMNREAFTAVLARWVDLGQAFALISVDLDGLRAVNDAHGHLAGDRVLAALSVRLQDHIRDGDVVARLGGDGFMILAQPPLATAALGILGRRLLTVLRQPIDIGGDTVAVSASLGIAVRDADQPSLDVLHQADRALFRAKARGGDGMAFFADDADETARGQAVIDHALGKEGPRTGLRLLIHPILPLEAPPDPDLGGLHRFELLARWQTEDGTRLDPASFIPVAEQLGRIGSITDRVLLSAADLWTRLDRPGLRLSINISSLDLHRAGWATQVLDRLTDARVPPSAFDFDLSESALVRLTPAVEDNLALLAAAGIGLALDDFGTGYSSLTVLERLPITAIKIDGRYLRENREDRRVAVLDSLIRLGHAFEKIVIAEGVETPADVALLARLGCDLAQGFYWARPVDPDRVFPQAVAREAPR